MTVPPNIHATKCHALGNDFLILNCITHPQNHEFVTEENIKQIAHRRFGIGCDQFIVLTHSQEIVQENSQKSDGKIIFYNADGSRAAACGNGTVACGVYVAKLLGKSEIFLETDVKIVKCTVNENQATVELPKAEVLEFDEERFLEKASLELFAQSVNFINVGNPHCVIFLKNTGSESRISQDEEFANIGKEIENLTEFFPSRTNVEFAMQTGENAFDCFIWERGSGATLTCGTGACAVARAAVHNNLANGEKPIFVTMAGSHQGGEVIPMKVKLKSSCTLFTNTVYFSGKVSL